MLYRVTLASLLLAALAGLPKLVGRTIGSGDVDGTLFAIVLGFFLMSFVVGVVRGLGSRRTSTDEKRR